MNFQEIDEGLASSVPSIPILSSSVAPKLFFDEYVAKRTPAVFQGHLTDAAWKGHLWTNAYLKDKASDCALKIEYRDDSSGRFGNGLEKVSTFGNLLTALEQRNPCFYLTTQDLVYDDDGMPHIISKPLDKLLDDFPLVPSLLSTLIPSNINIWMGYSETYSTSGLHHDYHDNLYILLRGQKRFTLYSPDEARNMYTVGELLRVHENGRINYRGQPTNADGSDINASQAANLAAKLDSAASRLENVNVVLFVLT
jgi:hypothetical protein